VSGLAISVDDYLYYVDDALDSMVAIVSELGDELASTQPPIPGANSAYAILTHCLGVMEYWAGCVVAGRTIQRDRDAEFVASGPVAPLVARARVARQQLARDVESLDPSAPARGWVRSEDAELPYASTQSGALFHVYEELAQHRGQMEVGRDALLATRE